VQKLSAIGRRDKLARDLAAAKTPLRRERKRENQKIGQTPNSDIHHSPDGSTSRVSIKNNRGNFGEGTKNE